MSKKRRKIIIIECYQVTLITRHNEVLDYYVQVKDFEQFLHRTLDSTCIVNDIVRMTLPHPHFTCDLCHRIDNDSHVVMTY